MEIGNLQYLGDEYATMFSKYFVCGRPKSLNLVDDTTFYMNRIPGFIVEVVLMNLYAGVQFVMGFSLGNSIVLRQLCRSWPE